MASGWDKLIGAKPGIEKVAGGFKFTEGPVCSRLGFVLFSDIPANRIMRFERGKVTVFRENSNAANGLTFDHQGRLLTCEQGRVTRTEKDGKITVLADKMNKPNDLVYSIDGGIYFSDPGAKAVYQITRKGEVRVVSRDGEFPNGVALAPNQQKLYVADSRERKIRVYDIAGDGALKNGRVFAEARPDGLKTDEEGNVWTTDDKSVTVFDAEGKRIGSVEIPEAPSNLGWGEGFHNLYVTARTSLYRLQTHTNGTRTY